MVSDAIWIAQRALRAGDTPFSMEGLARSLRRLVSRFCRGANPRAKSGVCRVARRHLYFSFASRKLIQPGAGIFHAETYISTQPAEALEEARIPDPHEDEERSPSAVAPSG
jgi:hypothetical protein